MNIALLGYGKMGHIIENIALARGHDVPLVIGARNRAQITAKDFADIDVAIDFSTPYAALANIALCFEANVPIVVGTTGWYEHLDKVKDKCLSGNKSLMIGSNFSIGVNIFFHINKLLAKAMRPYEADYEVQVEEVHHVHKLDAPSGTAITIAEDILSELDDKVKWVNNLVGSANEVMPKADELLIASHRIEEVPGTHTVIYSSEVDEIELKHTAHSRAGFAMGAVIAAEWLKDKKGFYTVKDMFDFN
ncbi:4-hydroxy-tetrahydrodipicolinate reductase [Olivibacter sitiensis]|uniref:4-hydroxy-tetrahydrodipicolinate reductase n=1 Tax=Olivibacter sitiensis TaxID=376470 RepID=UPI00041FB844|nr:4-hydroxy-tetrahydrodipicolinate reductase [Olivibacter sitiensis]